MKILEFKKYITWNIISIIGFFCTLITIVFWFWLSIVSSGLNIREDIDGYFSEYIVNFLLKPYFEMFVYQILFIILLVIGSKFEHKHYIENGEERLKLFEDNVNIYSKVYLTGIFLNFLPLFVLFVILIGYFLRHL